MARESRSIIVKDLPQWLQGEVSAAGHTCRDITVVASDRVGVVDFGGQGFRALVMVGYADGRPRQRMLGSFGGPNPYNHNRVDGTDPKYPRDSDYIPLERGIVVVRGPEGCGRMSLHVHPSEYVEIMPSRSHAVTAWEITVLNACSMKAGRYRDDEFSGPECFTHGRRHCYNAVCKAERKQRTAETLDSLEQRGLIKRNKRGAISVTTDGDNARRSIPYEPSMNKYEDCTIAEVAVYCMLRLIGLGRQWLANMEHRFGKPPEWIEYTCKYFWTGPSSPNGTFHTFVVLMRLERIDVNGPQYRRVVTRSETGAPPDTMKNARTAPDVMGVAWTFLNDTISRGDIRPIDVNALITRAQDIEATIASISSGLRHYPRFSDPAATGEDRLPALREELTQLRTTLSSVGTVTP